MFSLETLPKRLRLMSSLSKRPTNYVKNLQNIVLIVLIYRTNEAMQFSQSSPTQIHLKI